MLICQQSLVYHSYWLILTAQQDYVDTWSGTRAQPRMSIRLISWRRCLNIGKVVSRLNSHFYDAYQHWFKFQNNPQINHLFYMYHTVWFKYQSRSWEREKTNLVKRMPHKLACNTKIFMSVFCSIVVNPSYPFSESLLICTCCNEIILLKIKWSLQTQRLTSYSRCRVEWYRLLFEKMQTVKFDFR